MTKFYQAFFFMFIILNSITVEAQNFSNENNNQAQLQVEMSQMQEQMRMFQGKLDELQNSLKQFESYLKTSNIDTNARFEVLEKSKSREVSANIPSGSSSSTEMGATHAKHPEFSEVPTTPPTLQSPYTIPGQGEGLPDGEAQRKYTYAQQLLQEKNYLGAEASFKDLIHQHPDDPLIVNARYWLAEISFLKRDYAAAAVEFGTAYEAYQHFNKSKNTSQVPSKAPEILLKMALSLKMLGKTNDAKIILAKIRTSFPHMTADVKRHVDALSHELESK